MTFPRSGFLLLTLLAILSLSPAAMGQGEEARNMVPPGGLDVFPYQLVDYTQAGHEYRIHNSRAVVLGTITEIREIENTEKVLNWSATLRIESFLKMDKPQEQEGLSEIRFRYLPLQAPLKEFKVGDRCLVLLSRDSRHDHMLILGTDYHYYPVSEDGIVTKFFKEAPTADAPIIREVGLSDFLREIRRVLGRISIDEQAAGADLIFQGQVGSAAQGSGAEGNFYIVNITPDKIYKGDPGEGDIKIYSVNNMNDQVLKTLNRPVFIQGQTVFIFANKDPTLSAQGPDNPNGEAKYFPLSGKQSIWAVHPNTVWRYGTQPIKREEFFKKIDELTTR